MPKKKKSARKRVRRPRIQVEFSEQSLQRLEFHRQALAILPDPLDKQPGVAVFVTKADGKDVIRSCNCRVYRKKTCRHILELTKIYQHLGKEAIPKNFDTDFRNSIWFSLARILADGPGVSIDSIRMKVSSNGGYPVKVMHPDKQELITYVSSGADASRFIERSGRLPEDDLLPHRGAVLKYLSNLTLTDTERTLLANGMKSRGQALEGSFWFRLCYHGYREFGSAGCTFHPSVDLKSGRFMVTCRRASSQEPVFHLAVPPQRVKSLLTGLKECLPNQNDLPIHPIPVKTIFKVSRSTRLDLDVRPMIKLLQKEGEAKFFERTDLEKYRYGNLVFIKELGIMAELEPPGKSRKFYTPQRMMIKKYQVPEFLEEVGRELTDENFLVDPDVSGFKILRKFDRVEIGPDSYDRDWLWLSVKYGFGNAAVSLAEILRARSDGQRYIATPEGWVDCQSPALEDLVSFSGPGVNDQAQPAAGSIRLSRLELFRLRALGGEAVTITGDSPPVTWVKRLMEFKPAAPLPEIKGLTSSLRNYQATGVEWVAFLHENRFGGLLCDDMGLGKTHQVMAFMLFLKDVKKADEPFLVVCPTTVLSHWESKLAVHAPGLKAAVYHGPHRDLAAALEESRVLITSYGIVRRDIEKLKTIFFALAVFDEAQHIKNPKTKAFIASQAVTAGMKLGLSGTPIENSLVDLKVLLDLTVPGYLGKDEDFAERYVTPIEADIQHPRRQELSRLISPFTLRRLKKSVLHELPAKIEDIRTCRLSEDQVKLYRDAIERKGRSLLTALNDSGQQVPYIHIFALLTLLKQICNHPALVNRKITDNQGLTSGKWDLFKELLAESLDSGQKVVVYSQFLGMIDLVTEHLKSLDVDFVALTGASRNRGRIISRFNQDPACRVFVGSLKAGGVGIDLVAASVVIHYDRWWNAAREDQATDRVHRIGQRRGVQVFKLVTEGTLEEKIHAIIEKKRHLLDSVVQEDDPAVMKSFSRQDLIDMLRLPGRY